LFVQVVIFVAKGKSKLELLASRLKVAGIHVVSAFIVGYIDSPWFRHQRQFYTLFFVFLEYFPKAIAALELVQGKLHFDNVKSQKVARKFAVVRTGVDTLLKFSEQTFKICLSIFNSLVV